MYINIYYLIILLYPCGVYLCNYQLNETNGTIIFPSYNNNIECTWIFKLSLIPNNKLFRSLLLTFRHFDTEFGHDELFIGETIADVSKYNSKLYRYSGSKLPDPCFIPVRGETSPRSIWIQFTSDETNTGSGFIIDYEFLVNQSTKAAPPQVLISAEIRHPLEYKPKNSTVAYPYPSGTISSPNYPQNYSNDIVCRWHLYKQNAFIRLFIEEFHTELHYDTLTLYLGQNLNNRAMILYEWSGYENETKHIFIPNDNLFIIFNTDKSNNASGFSLNYDIIEKETFTLDLYDNSGVIHSKNYPVFVRTNIEYTWNFHMNNSNEIEINLIDISIDVDHDHLQIITGEFIYSLNTPKIYHFQTTNQTKLVFQTKHPNDDYQYRGFNLTYETKRKIFEENLQLKNLPCGKKYSSFNGTIEFSYEILTYFNCEIFIQVDDGQNIFLRFDYLNWDSYENYMEIGLFHEPSKYQLFHISDALHRTWFIANDSQIWIRFYSSQYSLGTPTFRLFFSETIQWSTVSPEPYVQILDDNRLFPYRLISIPTNDIYHNLTQAYIWHIEALDDELIKINFQSLDAINHRRICFHIKDSFNTNDICNNREFPYIYYRIGSCILSIEPEFIWILVKYDIQIEKYKKSITYQLCLDREDNLIRIISTQIDVEDKNIVLTPSITSHPFMHIEWLISMDKPSIVIFDIENLDGTTPAELILPETDNTTKTYSLGTIPLTRFCHVFNSTKLLFRILYTTYSLPYHNQNRLFRINIYKISRNYFSLKDFHYIFYKKNQTNTQWTIHGRHDTSIFLGNLYSSNKNLTLQTTANVNLTVDTSSISIPNSDFDIRYNLDQNFNSDFLIVLYEQEKKMFYQNIILNKTSDILQTNHFALYEIYIQSELFDSIDFILIKADNGTIIRLYDLNVDNNGYFLLNSLFNDLSSLVGLRFSIKTFRIRIELQSKTNNLIQLRYKTRHSSIETSNCYLNVCKENNKQTCHESCSNWFDFISMNNTRIHYSWPYALRGSVTLIIENTTIENFERVIYRNLRDSIAKIVQKFCLKYKDKCLTKDTNAIRADHVIIQSYEEQLDDHRLYVAIFIKDPYRQTIALTNEQFILALQYNQQEIYQDIKHHINLPATIYEPNSLDPIWLYGVCSLALLVLIVVILMLITILMKKTSSTNRNTQDKQLEKSKPKLTNDNDSLLLPSPIRLASDDVLNCSSSYNETESSQTTTTKPSTIPYHHFPTGHKSYFNSEIEAAIKSHLNDDDEPIPFIDDNISNAHSRKSSICWSDKTSLSSRFSFAWKLNRLRSNSQNRSPLSKEKRRHQHRTNRLTISPSSQQNQSNVQL